MKARKRVGAVRFSKACDPSGGEDKLPFCRSVGYAKAGAGEIRTFRIGRQRYIALDEIERIVREYRNAPGADRLEEVPHLAAARKQRQRST